jgi:hypothetical protein
MVADLRAQEPQAAEELGQWKTHHEERKVIDASQVAITCRKPSTASAPRGACPSIPANAVAADGRPRMDGRERLESDPRRSLRAVAGGAADGRPSLSRFPPLEPGIWPWISGAPTWSTCPAAPAGCWCRA